MPSKCREQNAFLEGLFSKAFWVILISKRDATISRLPVVLDTANFDMATSNTSLTPQQFQVLIAIDFPSYSSKRALPFCAAYEDKRSLLKKFAS
jgi:hypothetical protein